VHLHWSRDEIGDVQRLRMFLSRERRKESTLDYGEAEVPEDATGACFAVRRGLAPDSAILASAAKLVSKPIKRKPQPKIWSGVVLPKLTSAIPAVLPSRAAVAKPAFNGVRRRQPSLYDVAANAVEQAAAAAWEGGRTQAGFAIARIADAGQRLGQAVVATVKTATAKPPQPAKPMVKLQPVAKAPAKAQAVPSSAPMPPPKPAAPPQPRPDRAPSLAAMPLQPVRPMAAASKPPGPPSSPPPEPTKPQSSPVLATAATPAAGVAEALSRYEAVFEESARGERQLAACGAALLAFSLLAVINEWVLFRKPCTKGWSASFLLLAPRPEQSYPFVFS